MSTEAGAAASQGTGNGSGSGATEKPTWIEQLPEAMRGDESLYGFKTIGDLVTQHKTAMAEREGLIRVPGDQATDEERAAFFAKIGRPEKPDGYVLGRPEGIPDNLFNPAMVQKYADVFHKLGIPKSAAEAVWGEYYKDVAENAKAVETQRQQMIEEQKRLLTEADNSLRTEWGGDYTGNVDKATRAFKALMKPGEEALLEEKVGNLRFGDHPAFLRMFHRIFDAIGPDSAMFAGGGSGAPPSDEKELARKMFPSMKE